MRKPRVLATLIAIIAVVVGVMVPLTSASATSAPVGGTSSRDVKMSLVGFNPGNLISDAVFFDANSMSSTQIQTFLNGKVPTCLTGGDKYGPYVCLKDYRIATSSKTADQYCRGYEGASSESAAQIIAKVAQSCGINPQVLLVMLQKEQSLVLNVWPSAWRYDIAMGHDCPDFSTCNPAKKGFLNQVYGAARQMQIYAEGRYFTYYAPGKTWNIRYSPDVNCGSSPVYVSNIATSAMYYYTPYQPNAAALAAGTGEAPCGAYGNRNFYNYFTDWFGSTQVAASAATAALAIQGEYVAQGGDSSLGAATSDVLRLTQNGGGYAKAFANGSIYWTSTYGAKTVRAGALRDYYFGRLGADGVIGWPVANQQTFAQGAAQAFTGGSIYSGVRGTALVTEPIRSAYFTQNGSNGPMGMPVADQSCAGTVCYQVFEAGNAVSSSAGTFAVWGAIFSGYVAAGGMSGPWGVPTSAIMGYPDGVAQAFAGGSVYAAHGGNAYSVSGAIRDFYFKLGGATSRIGFPIGAQVCTSDLCSQDFQYGAILWSQSGGARLGAREIEAVATAQSATLGTRVPSSFVYYSYNGSGMAEAFANGTVYFKRGVGAYSVTGRIRDLYFAAGGAAGKYGWPTSAQTCTGDTCSQTFESGAIFTTGGVAYEVTGAVFSAYRSAGGISGSWGAPKSNLVNMVGGVGQAFGSGSAYAVANGGAYFVSGPIRDYYFGLGGATGRLGFPVGAQSCTSTLCSQEFQYGWILWSSPSGARIGAPAIDAVATAQGSTLGSRVASSFVYYTVNGGGMAEVYANGAVFFKRGVGAFAVSGGIRDLYFAAGGAAGRYGWPTSAPVCSGASCSQTFEGGTLRY